jgi:protein-S-isoprenylcysteine O-methyltransferase Ste14
MSTSATDLRMPSETAAAMISLRPRVLRSLHLRAAITPSVYMARTLTSRRLHRLGTPLPVLRDSLKALVGVGDRIGLFTLPFLIVGLILNVAYPSVFDVGGPPTALRVVSVAVLAAGVAIWAWSVTLIVARVPRAELITRGPYAVVKHPLYTAAALLVLPWLGFLLNTWLGAFVGVVMYVASRMFAPAEEAALSKTFGAAWTEYSKAVKISWL